MKRRSKDVLGALILALTVVLLTSLDPVRPHSDETATPAIEEASEVAPTAPSGRLQR